MAYAAVPTCRLLPARPTSPASSTARRARSRSLFLTPRSSPWLRAPCASAGRGSASLGRSTSGQRYFVVQPPLFRARPPSRPERLFLLAQLLRAQLRRSRLFRIFSPPVFQ